MDTSQPEDQKQQQTAAIFRKLAAVATRPGAKWPSFWQEPPLIYQSLVHSRKIHAKHGKQIDQITLDNIEAFEKDIHLTEDDWPECWMLDRFRRVNQEIGHVDRADLGDLSEFNVPEEIVAYWIKSFKLLNKEAKKFWDNA